MSFKLFILVGLGGALGSISRFVIGNLFTCFSPWTTLCINLAGGFTIGCFHVVFQKLAYPEFFRAFWMVGFCGGFTTFSAFGLDFYKLFQQQQYAFGILYISVSIIGTILAVFLGFKFASVTFYSG